MSTKNTISVKTSKEHYEKFSSYVNKFSHALLETMIPATKEEIEKCILEGDIHLNKIPLYKWEGYSHEYNPIRRTSYTCPASIILSKTISISISETVCVLKHFAKYHIAGAVPDFTDSNKEI